MIRIVFPDTTKTGKQKLQSWFAPASSEFTDAAILGDFVPSAHYNNMLTFQLRADELYPEERIIFIDDSLVQALPVDLVADNAINYGIGSDDTVGVLNRMNPYASLAKAKAVVVAVGVNDLNNRSDDDFISNYAVVLESMPADVVVLCSLMLPIEESARDDWKGRSSQRIRSVNERMTQVCCANGHVVVDATSALAGEDGELLSAYHVGDGLHLSADGYEAWITVLKPAVQNAMQ